MQKYWTIAFYLACVACPALLLLAQHNYGLMQYYAGTVGILATVGIGGLGVAAGAVALVAHHKLYGGAAGILPLNLPSIPAAASPADAAEIRQAQKEHILELYWNALGPNATDDEIVALKKMRAANQGAAAGIAGAKGAESAS